MATWNNADGLFQKFGPAQHRSSHAGGVIAGHGHGELCLEVEINMGELSTTDVVLNHSVWLPDDALITHVRAFATTAVVGSSGVLDVGLGYYATAGSSTLTLLSAQAILAAHAVASMALGEVSDFVLASDGTINDYGVAAIDTGGAYIGTEIISTKNRYYVTASENDSNAFSSGVLKVQTFYIPQGVTKTNTPTA